jgi:hypothetical protein
LKVPVQTFDVEKIYLGVIGDDSDSNGDSNDTNNNDSTNNDKANNNSNNNRNIDEGDDDDNNNNDNDKNTNNDNTNSNNNDTDDNSNNDRSSNNDSGKVDPNLNSNPSPSPNPDPNPHYPPGGRVLYSSIRKRSQGGFHAYGLTTVKQLESGQKVELKQVISARVYYMLVKTSADKKRNIIKQRRYCFLWGQQSIHISQYLSPEGYKTHNLWTLLCQSENEPTLPAFIIENGVKLLDDTDNIQSSFLLSKK